MLVVVDEHDTISGYDTHQSNESDEVSRRHHSSRQPDSDHPSEPSCDDPEKYLEYQYYTPKMPIQHSKKSDKYADGYDGEKSG